MLKNNVEDVQGINIKKITPVVRPKRKPASQKKADAINFLTEQGIPDPEGAWEQLQKTQKYGVPEENSEY